LELPNESAPSDGLHFVVRLDARTSAEELSDAIICATAAGADKCVTPPFIATKDAKKVAALWDAQRRVFPLAQVVRQPEAFACTSDQAERFLTGDNSTKELRNVQGMKAFAIAPPPLDPAARLRDSLKEQLEGIEMPLDLCKKILDDRQKKMQKKGETETAEECSFNIMVAIAEKVFQPRLQALYKTDKARWKAELEIALDPKRGQGWRKPLGLILLNEDGKVNAVECCAAVALLGMLVTLLSRWVDCGLQLVTGIGPGELLLWVVSGAVLLVRGNDALRVKADFAGGVRRALDQEENTKQRKILGIEFAAVAAVFASGGLPHLGSAAVYSVVDLAATCRYLAGATLAAIPTVCDIMLMPVLSDLLLIAGFGVSAVRNVFRAHATALFMHAPRFLGGWQLPVDPDTNGHRDAVLAACDQATGGLHAPGFWASIEHRDERWAMCQALLQRKCQGLSVFVEQLLVLLLLALLLKVCWVHVRPWAVVRPVLVRLRAWAPTVAAVAAAALLERPVMWLAVTLPIPVWAASCAGAAIVVCAVSSILEIRLPVKKRA
jgi:hypothetical protein